MKPNKVLLNAFSFKLTYKSIPQSPISHYPHTTFLIYLNLFPLSNKWKLTLSPNTTVVTTSNAELLIPTIALPKSNIPNVWAPAQSAEPINMRNRPNCKTLCRPNTSQSWPKAGMNAVPVMVKAVTIHDCWESWSGVMSVSHISLTDIYRLETTYQNPPQYAAAP